MKAYERETDMWNKIFEEYQPIDLRGVELRVEPMFDEALELFAGKTKRVMDFGCGTGDVSFQYLQYQPDHQIIGVDKAEIGIKFAKETARLSHYKRTHFFTAGEEFLDQFQKEAFDGIILSNVLDVMPKDVSYEIMLKLNKLLKHDGYWFVKMNPYYSNEELDSLGYQKTGANLYEEEGVLHLRQATTEYWKKQLSEFGEIIDYLEFQYPWQKGMNRLFVIKNNNRLETAGLD
ncbi:class I SAM-dependent methyltransferase [Lacrimispora sp.]|uniref:class I SAM-dependent methyltransferase n=1 Tax=Lacrimispora sp. TaxID=2719234 RepID=UPI0028A7D374|nr:class I SAM-dependent methyltransferase [Lacrimispora sp.]